MAEHIVSISTAEYLATSMVINYTISSITIDRYNLMLPAEYGFGEDTYGFGDDSYQFWYEEYRK